MVKAEKKLEIIKKYYLRKKNGETDFEHPYDIIMEVNKKGYKYIHEEDVWNYLKTYKWTSSRDLDLGDMVNDIFNVDISSLNAFVQDELKEYHRSIKEET